LLEPSYWVLGEVDNFAFAVCEVETHLKRPVLFGLTEYVGGEVRAQFVWEKVWRKPELRHSSQQIVFLGSTAVEVRSNDRATCTCPNACRQTVAPREDFLVGDDLGPVTMAVNERDGLRFAHW